MWMTARAEQSIPRRAAGGASRSATPPLSEGVGNEPGASDCCANLGLRHALVRCVHGCTLSSSGMGQPLKIMMQFWTAACSNIAATLSSGQRGNAAKEGRARACSPSLSALSLESVEKWKSWGKNPKKSVGICFPSNFDHGHCITVEQVSSARGMEQAVLFLRSQDGLQKR